MSTSKNLAARAALTRPAKSEAPGETEAPVKKGAALRTKPIKLSVEISPKQYNGLSEYSRIVAMAKGRPRVPHVEVFRALLEVLEDDEHLQAEVEARIAGIA